MKLTPDGEIESLTLPAPSSRVMGSIRWGRYDNLFTPAFWVSRLWIDGIPLVASPRYRLGTNLEEEVVACMLGGHGMPAEVGIAAYSRFRERGLIRHGVTEQELSATLLEPLSVGIRSVRYRYPKQKARFISAALTRLGNEVPPVGDEVVFRDWLVSFDGIGPKTASWITRNWLGSDEVAILDIHLHRAGMIIGLYNSDDDMAKHYRSMETKLVRFAKALGVKLSELDDLVWRYMKNWNKLAIGSLESKQLGTAGR